MTEYIFKDIEKNLHLAKFQRNLDTKSIKAGKFFWHFSLMYFCSDSKFDPHILTNNFADIFYRPAEIQTIILEHFNGIPTEQIRKLDLEKVAERYHQKVFSDIRTLLKEMGDFLINNPQDYEHVDSAKADFLDLDFLDKKQPYLPTPSKAFKYILDAAGVYYNENEFFSDIKYLKPSTVHELNAIMDEIIKAEQLFHSVTYLQSSLNTPQQEFQFRNFANGPTDALQKALEIQPDAAKLSVAELSYSIRLKYVNQKGKQLNEETLKKVITRYQAKNGK